MKVILQVVDSARVEIASKVKGEINRGFLLYVGFTHNDNKDLIDKMIDKILSLRIFPDENGLTNLSLFDVKGEILSISQFTLYANIKKGRRPSFVDALNPLLAKELYNYFNLTLTKKYGPIQEGVFGEDMKVYSLNHGPFTLTIDSKELF